MGNVERVDKTLALNDMIYYVRKDAELRRRWREDLAGLAREFALSEPEFEALQAIDVRRLMDIGVHQYLIPHILRLFHGTTNMTNTHPAMVAYQEAFPRQSKEVLEGSKWDAGEAGDG